MSFIITIWRKIPNRKKQEQQRVAVGPGNAQLISIRQVASDASLHVRPAATAAAAATAALLTNN